jgi:hypothetical protein
MSTLSGGPNITTENLVLYLDATNPKSYPGNGNTWFDISGHENHFTLFNNPSLIDGTLAFTTNEYAQLTITSSTIQIPELLPNNTSFTVETIYKFVDIGSTGKFLGTGNYGRGGWNLGVGSNDFNAIDFSAYDGQCNDGANCQYNRGNVRFSIPNNTSSYSYYQIVYDCDIKTTSLYINGTLMINQYDATYGTGANPQGVGATADFFIARTPQGGWTNKKGYCGSVRYYNRALTSSEIRQNFNATRARFGV